MITPIARIKGLIYVAGDTGISIKQLSSITGLRSSKVVNLLKKINQNNTVDPNVAWRLLNIDGKYQMVTKRELNRDVQKFFKNTDASILTSAALETLTIIAYKQPITRIEIDDIRGVNSAMTIQKLLQQKLIQKHGRKKVVGKPIMYITTKAFLNLFGLKNIKQLPKIKSVK